MILPDGKNVVGSKWVYKIKTTSDGDIRYKARIVARGFSQKYGEDYDKIFAPVIKQSTIRLMLCIAGAQKLSVHHYDYKTAFLNSQLEEDIFMKQPEGYIVKGQEHLVCKLNKSIYELKQAARTWNQTINDELCSIGFRRGSYDPCLYVREDVNPIYVLLYVDDILLVSKSLNLIKEVGRKLEQKFDISCLGQVANFLGIQMERSLQGIFSIHQKSFIQKILHNFRLNDTKGSKLPMDTGFPKLDNSKDEPFEYPEL